MDLSKAMHHPTVKNARAAEHSRMAKASKRHAVVRQRLVNTLQHLDSAAKSACIDDLQELAAALQERVAEKPAAKEDE